MKGKKIGAEGWLPTTIFQVLDTIDLTAKHIIAVEQGQALVLYKDDNVEVIKGPDDLSVAKDILPALSMKKLKAKQSLNAKLIIIQDYGFKVHWSVDYMNASGVLSAFIVDHNRLAASTNNLPDVYSVEDLAERINPIIDKLYNDDRAHEMIDGLSAVLASEGLSVRSFDVESMDEIVAEEHPSPAPLAHPSPATPEFPSLIPQKPQVEEVYEEEEVYVEEEVVDQLNQQPIVPVPTQAQVRPTPIYREPIQPLGPPIKDLPLVIMGCSGYKANPVSPVKAAPAVMSEKDAANFCPKCGYKDPGTRFCQDCGYKL